MQMIFHHLGMACESIEDTLAFLIKVQGVEGQSKIIFDPLQQASLCMVNLQGGTQIELIAGEVVRNYVKKGIYLYHTCWQVPEMDRVVEQLTTEGLLLVSPPKPAVLFDGRRVAFFHSPLGIMELLEMDYGTQR